MGVDAVLLSFPLLGLPLTVARIVCAFVVAVLAGKHCQPLSSCTFTSECHRC
ncbi:MAG: hypothetical protein U0787_17215 [Polyangia bacterium]